MREIFGVEEALRADSMYWYAGVIPVPPTICERVRQCSYLKEGDRRRTKTSSSTPSVRESQVTRGPRILISSPCTSRCIQRETSPSSYLLTTSSISPEPSRSKEDACRG